MKTLTYLAAGILASLLFTSQAQDLSTGLVTYWPLDDGLSSPANTVIDALQSANPIELTSPDPGAAWLSGPSAKSRGSLRVDGAETFVVVPSTESLDIGTEAVTLSLWVKLSLLPSEMAETHESILADRTALVFSLIWIAR